MGCRTEYNFGETDFFYNIKIPGRDSSARIPYEILSFESECSGILDKTPATKGVAVALTSISALPFIILPALHIRYIPDIIVQIWLAIICIGSISLLLNPTTHWLSTRFSFVALTKTIPTFKNVSVLHGRYYEEVMEQLKSRWKIRMKQIWQENDSHDLPIEWRRERLKWLKDKGIIDDNEYNIAIFDLNHSNLDANVQM